MPGVEVEARDVFGRTPLMEAVRWSLYGLESRELLHRRIGKWFAEDAKVLVARLLVVLSNLAILAATRTSLVKFHVNAVNVDSRYQKTSKCRLCGLVFRERGKE